MWSLFESLYNDGDYYIALGFRIKKWWFSQLFWLVQIRFEIPIGYVGWWNDPWHEMTCDGQKSSSHACHGPPFQRSDWVTSCALGILQNYTICLGVHFVSLITKENPPSKYTRDFLRGWLLHEKDVAAKGMPRITSEIPIEYSYRSTWFLLALLLVSVTACNPLPYLCTSAASTLIIFFVEMLEFSENKFSKEI